MDYNNFLMNNNKKNNKNNTFFSGLTIAFGDFKKACLFSIKNNKNNKFLMNKE